MDARRWTAMLAQMTAHEAADIDPITREFDPRTRPPGRDLFPERITVLLPEARLKDASAVCVGVRVTEPAADAVDRALRLAAFAIERDVEVVVLAHVDTCGFERLGFRVERIAGDTDAAREDCERQVCRFWNIDMVI